MDKFWRLLYKNIDGAQVILEILDARNPIETRCTEIEEYIRNKDKILVLILNKADLVPQNIIKRWHVLLNKEFPTIYLSTKSKNPLGLKLLKEIINRRCPDERIMMLIVLLLIIKEI